MGKDSITKKASVKRLWEQFVDRACKNGVQKPALRWHVYRMETYLKAFLGKRLSLSTADKMSTGICSKLG